MIYLPSTYPSLCGKRFCPGAHWGNHMLRCPGPFPASHHPACTPPSLYMLGKLSIITAYEKRACLSHSLTLDGWRLLQALKQRDRLTTWTSSSPQSNARHSSASGPFFLTDPHTAPTSQTRTRRCPRLSHILAAVAQLNTRLQKGHHPTTLQGFPHPCPSTGVLD